MRLTYMATLYHIKGVDIIMDVVSKFKSHHSIIVQTIVPFAMHQSLKMRQN